MQGIFLSSRTRCRRCEGSLAFARLGGDSSLLYVSFRMTHLSFRVRLSGRRGIFDFLLFEILRCSAPQNDIVPTREHRLARDSSLRYIQNDTSVIPNRGLSTECKEVTKKGRLLIIGYSFFPLRSPTEAAELAPLRQPSPYFYLLSRSRQPDKGGHFPTPTLPTIKGVGGSYLSFRVRPVARRGIPSFLLVTLYSRLAEDSSRQSLSE